jgi:hypothetical protein
MAADGTNRDTTAGISNRNSVVTDPASFATVIGPDVASVGTIVINWFWLDTWNRAATPLNRTFVICPRPPGNPVPKFTPEMVTNAPPTPVTGEKSSTRGGAMKNCRLEAAPDPLVKTEIGPVNAFAGTRARTLVAVRDTICPGASVEPK